MPPREKSASLPSRGAELLLAILLVAAFLSAQVLIGGTRLLFALPAYGLLAAISVLALFLVRVPKPAPSQVCLWSAVVFLGYIIARGAFSPVSYLARLDIYSVLAGLVVYFITSCLLTSAKTRMSILAGLLVAAMAHVFVGAIQFRYGNNFMPIAFLQRFDYGPRASGFYICPNHLAGLLEVLGIFGLSITCWSRWPLWSKLLIGYATVVCYVGVALTGSRGGYLSVTASLLVFGLLSLNILRAGGRTLLLRLGIPSLIMAGLTVLVAFSLMQKSEYLMDRTRRVADNDIRLNLWRASLEQWKMSPLLGTGSRTYLFYGRRFRSEQVQVDPVYVHNDYLQLLSEYGLVGALVFLTFLFVHLRRGWINAQRLGPKRIAISHRLASNAMAINVGALSAVSAYVVHSVFDFNLHIPANLLLLACVFGMLANPGIASEAPARPQQGPSFWLFLTAAIGAVLGFLTWRTAPGEYYAEQARAALRDYHARSALGFALKALEYEKTNPTLQYYLGRARALAGEQQQNPEARASFYRAALPAYARARVIAPLDETYAIELAFTYDALQRFSEAEWMYDEALAFDPHSVSAQRYYKAHLDQWKAAESH